MIFVTFREYFLGKKLSFVEMAILCLSGRAIPRVLSESLPAERAFWTFQVSTRLSDFSKCIYNNSYCYYNKKLFHEKSQNFFEKSRGFFYLFFENFTLPFVLMYITISISILISKIKNIYLKIFTSISLEIT